MKASRGGGSKADEAQEIYILEKIRIIVIAGEEIWQKILMEQGICHTKGEGLSYSTEKQRNNKKGRDRKAPYGHMSDRVNMPRRLNDIFLKKKEFKSGGGTDLGVRKRARGT